MKGLLNLLTVLVPLLDLTTGCGLRTGGIARQGLLKLGAALVEQRLSAGNTGSTLGTVGAGLGGSSTGSLLTSISSLSRSGLVGGLTSGTSGLGSGGAVSGLRSLNQRLGGGGGGSLLAGIGALTVAGMRASGSTVGVGSGATIPMSGPSTGLLLSQGLQQTHREIAGQLVAASTTGSQAAALGGRIGANAAGSILGITRSQLDGISGGVASPGSSAPPFSGPGSGGLPGQPVVVPEVGPAVGLPAGGRTGGLPAGGLELRGSSSSSISATSISTAGGNTLQVPGQPLQQIPHGSGGESLGTGSVTTQSTTVSAARFAASRVENLGVAGSPNRGGSTDGVSSGVAGLDSQIGGLGVGAAPGAGLNVGLVGGGGMGSLPSGSLRGGSPSSVNVPGLNNPASGIERMHRTGQLVQQTATALSAGSVGVVHGAIRSTAQLAGNTVGSAMRVVGNVNGANIAGGPSDGVNTLGLNEALSAQGAGVAAGNTVGSVDALGRPVGGAFGVRGSSGGSVSASRISSSGVQTMQRLGQSLQQTATAVGAGPFGAVNDALTSPTQLARNGVGTAMGPTEILNGDAPGGGPSRGVNGLGSRGVGSGVQTTQTLRQSLQQTTTAVRSGSFGTVSDVLTSPTQVSGNTIGTTLGAPDILNGAAPEGGPSRRLNGLSSSGVGSGINLGQAPGPGGEQGGQLSSGQSFAAVNAMQHSSTTMGTHLAGNNLGNGINLGQGLTHGAQPTSRGSSGGSIVAVSSSSHRSSSWHASFSGSSQGHTGTGLPSPGGNAPGVGAPSGGGNLLDAIATAATRGAAVGVPGTVPAGGPVGVVPSVSTVSGTSSSISGITHHGQLPQRKRMSAAAATGIALGTVASALAIGALGTGIASAIQNGMITGGGRSGGCPRQGCRSGCGRKRRSVKQSKVPAEILENIPMNFDRL